MHYSVYQSNKSVLGKFSSTFSTAQAALSLAGTPGVYTDTQLSFSWSTCRRMLSMTSSSKSSSRAMTSRLALHCRKAVQTIDPLELTLREQVEFQAWLHGCTRSTGDQTEEHSKLSMPWTAISLCHFYSLSLAMDFKGSRHAMRH